VTACARIIRETYTRLSGNHTLKLQLDATGVDAMAGNLRGLTEETAERAISQAVVGRLALSPDCVTDVLDAKKALLKRSEMLEFVDATEDMASVGGLENLKQWLAQRRGAWDDGARQFGLDPPKGVILLGVQGCGKSLCARAVAGEWKLPLVKIRHRRRLRQIYRRNRKAHPESLQSSRRPSSLRPVDRRTGKSFRRKRPRFRFGGRRRFITPACVILILDAGTQARRLRSRHLQ